MKLLKKGLFLALLVCAGIFSMSMSCQNDPNNPAPSLNLLNLTVPSKTAITQVTYQGKKNVAHITPNPAYDWAVLTYSLNDYAGKEITITLSMDVWLTTSTKVAWQAQLDSEYPLIAGSYSAQRAGQWVSITDSATILVPAGGGTFYLSSQQLGVSNEIYIANFAMAVLDGSGEENEVSTGQGKILKMTIGAKENLTGRITNFTTAGRTLTWSSSDTDVATVNPNGVVTAVGFTDGGISTVASEATGTAVITVTTEDGDFSDTFTINTTLTGQVDIMTLPPMKDQFASHFLIGNITRGGDYSSGNSPTITNMRLTRHFNVLTSENDMKPDVYGGSRNGTTVTGLTWTRSDAFVNAVSASGIKVHGHVLLWHSQNPGWISALNSNTGKDTALGALRSYITQVVDRYKGKVYSWDILNEVFPDMPAANADWKTAMRTNNPWFASIGSDFVFEGYKAARQADPGVILYYNDYNLDNASKAGATHRMVRDVNLAWESDPLYNQAINLDKDGKPRKLIEGIGMQSHHNTGVSANRIMISLNLFRQLGVKISISEIDVLSQGWSDYEKRVTPINSGRLQATELYGRYFKLFLDNADIIERVSFWGVYDEQSWRSRGRPLVFEGARTSMAKPAYYKIIEALEER